MRVCSLGSGSKGNATLVQSGDTTLLVDCGFGLREAESRLAERGISPESLSAILVTHEHGDHLKGAPMLANKYRVPLYASHGTSRHFKRNVPSAKLICAAGDWSIGDIQIKPVTVPHDSDEPIQFVFASQGKTFGLLTDLGSITKHIIEAYQQCNILMLECNHDINMLKAGPYPPSLKRRVGGRFGHLNNEQARDFLSNMTGRNLQKVLISHISEHNNDPNLALDTIAPSLTGYEIETSLLSQQAGCDWVAPHAG